jgi:hypothetical protein
MFDSINQYVNANEWREDFVQPQNIPTKPILGLSGPPAQQFAI